MELHDILNQLPFKDIGCGGIYAVGGCVRDMILGIEPKDIDLVITGIGQQLLIQSLKGTGRVDLVGESFAIIKYRPHEGPLKNFEFDIALPRKERKIGLGHADFEVDAGPHISLVEDLYRRDFTMNAIAFGKEGFIDPWHGRVDIDKRVIRLVNPDAFEDDPLRMLRGIQFASRLGFTFDLDTLVSLTDNAKKIDLVSAERKYMELEKIALKGDCGYAGRLLESAGLYKRLFANCPGVASDYYMNSDNIRTVPELVMYLTNGVYSDSNLSYLKGTKDNIREIKALSKLYELFSLDKRDPILKERQIIYDAYRLFPGVFRTTLFDAKARHLSTAIKAYVKAKYPLSPGDLACTGEEILDLGIQGPNVGILIRRTIEAVLSDKIQNTRVEVLEFIKEEQKYL